MRYIALVAVVTAMFFAAPAFAQANLPVSVRAKMLEADAGDALKAGDFPTALKKLEEYRKLGIAVSPAMMYLEARAALAANDLPRSKRVFEEYFKAGGEGDPNFTEALTLYRKMLPAAEAAEAKAKAEKDAATKAGWDRVKARQDSAVALYGAQLDCAGCPQMVVIPASSFTMGSDKTKREVWIPKAFAIGRTEVTFNEWDACVAEKACRRRGDEGWGKGTRPVINVTWQDAKKYVAWLSKKTGRTFRLPSEAEWEYAARGGSSGNWGMPPGVDNVCQFANTLDETVERPLPEGFSFYKCKDGFGALTAPVASFKPNLWGVHDAIGNVWEHVEDCWHADMSKAPTDGSAWTEQCDSAARVDKGGSYYSKLDAYTVFSRYSQDPGSATRGDGFRVVMELDHQAAMDDQARKRAEFKETLEADARARAQPVKDCPTCPDMAVIPPGTFEIEPGRKITFAKPYAVGRYEVTFAEWDACVEAGGCSHRPSDEGWGRDSRPVMNVSWLDVQEYIRWLNERTGQKYRLPTEAELTYAARTTYPPFSGSISDDMFCKLGNLPDQTLSHEDFKRAGNSLQCFDGAGMGTTAVGSYGPNSWGLYDTVGNVAEWLADCRHDDFEGMPADGTAWTTNCKENGERQMRGRSWWSYTMRQSSGEGERWTSVGFRLMRD